MASPITSSIPREEAARIHNFAEQLRTKLRPHESHYRYNTLLRLLDHDPVPESLGVVGEEGPKFGEFQSAGSSALVVQADSLFREWKRLSIDLLADKDSQSEAIIHDETERLRKEIEAQAQARALAAGEIISSSGPAEPDVSWLSQCMAHRNVWRPSRGKSQRSSDLLPSLLCQGNGANLASLGQPLAGHHPRRTPFSPVNGRFGIADRRGSIDAKILGE